MGFIGFHPWAKNWEFRLLGLRKLGLRMGDAGV